MEESDEMKKLNELEILASMYDQDLLLSDPSCIPDLSTVTSAQQSSLTSGHHKYLKSIRFTLKLTSPMQNHLEATFDLPSSYPSELPIISIRCNSIQVRAQAVRLHSDLHCHLTSHVPQGEPAVVEAVQWLVSNVDEYVNASLPCEKVADQEVEKEDAKARYWIYSHHIYNTTKRKTIVDTARNLHLCGFCMPGKPGLVCVEGDQSACEEFWQAIKTLTWKKITLKHVEVQETPSLPSPGKEHSSSSSSQPPASSSSQPPSSSSSQPPATTWCSFKRFDEVFFSSTDSRHGDMSQLQHFLNNYNLPHAFHIFFGIDGNKDDKS